MDLLLNSTPVRIERVAIPDGHLHRLLLPPEADELHRKVAVTCLKQFTVQQDPEPKGGVTQISVVGATGFADIFAVLRSEGFEIKRRFA